MEKKFKKIGASQIAISQLMLPSHSNFSGKIHGGHILNLMDQIAFACASKHSREYCVTASVDTVDFLNPIEVGELVTMKASINYVGRSSMVVGIRVEAENIQSGFVKHCNSSFFTMIAKNDKGESTAVPGLILENKNDIRRFMKCVKRSQMKKQRSQEFHETDFTSENYVKHLVEYNVQIVMDS